MRAFSFETTVNRNMSYFLYRKQKEGIKNGLLIIFLELIKKKKGEVLYRNDKTEILWVNFLYLIQVF